MSVFVPTPPPPSPEAIELGKRIAEAVRILRQENPSLRREDVTRGLRLAESELRAELGGPDRKLILVMVGLLVILGGLAAFFVASGGTLSPITLIAALVVVLGVIAAAVAVSRR